MLPGLVLTSPWGRSDSTLEVEKLDEEINIARGFTLAGGQHHSALQQCTFSLGDSSDIESIQLGLSAFQPDVKQHRKPQPNLTIVYVLCSGKADVAIVLYAADRPDTLANVSARWIPLLSSK
eukprot:3403131-Rhodomonas_salina.1